MYKIEATTAGDSKKKQRREMIKNTLFVIVDIAVVLVCASALIRKHKEWHNCLVRMDLWFYSVIIIGLVSLVADFV